MSILSELEETNTVGDAGGQYSTPNFTGEIDPDAIEDYFDVVDDEEDEKEEDDEEDDEEISFKKFASEMYIDERTYKDYERDNSVSNKRKLNKTVSNLNGQLQTIERILDQNIKLKGNKDLSSRDVWKTTRNNVSKIQGRLTRIQTKLTQLMS